MKKTQIYAIFAAVVLFLFTGCDWSAFLPEREPLETLVAWEENSVTDTEVTTAVPEATLPPETSAAETAVPETTLPETVTAAPIVTIAVPEEMTKAPDEALETMVLETVAPVTTTAVPKPSMKPNRLKYTYNQLPDSLKIVYDKILTAAENYEKDVYFNTPVPLDTLTKVYNTVLWEEMSVRYLNENEFHYSGNPVTRMQLSYSYTKAQTEQMNKAVEQRAQQIIGGITPDMSTVDILRYFHDTIIENCTYDLSTEFCGTAYGALVEGRALCQGYSYAFGYLCNLVGIENTYVTGYAGEEHMWNMVKINGRWYHVDVTWDDPTMSGGEEYVTYDYFCVSDKEMSNRTIHEGLVKRPAAVSMAENYFVYNGLYASSYEEAKNIIYSEFIKRASLGEDYVYIRLASDAVYAETLKMLFDNQGIYSIQQQALMKSSRSFDAARTVYLQNDDVNTIILKICY